jgi:hypothetical protein
MKDTFKKKPKDRQGLRYKTIKAGKELDRDDDKWIANEVEEYESQQRKQSEDEG